MSATIPTSAGGLARGFITVGLLSTGVFLLAFGNVWAPSFFALLSGSEIGAWLGLIVPFLPMVLIGSGAACYTSRRWARKGDQ